MPGAVDESRAVHLPKVAAVADCPISPTTEAPAAVLGRSIGTGPLYPIIPNHGVLRVTPAQFANAISGALRGTFLEKVIWGARPGFRQSAVIRGVDRVANTKLRFLTDGGLSPQLRISYSTAGSAMGWPTWAAYVVVDGPGCFTFDVQGDGFSQELTFRTVLVRR